jgi:SAM-dependent methyltransferase
MTNHAQLIRSTIGAVVALDAEWRTSPAGRDDLSTYLPYMPTPPWPDFVALLAEALPEAVTGDRFLEIGAGVGTRMMLAEAVFGLDVHGVERVPEYVKAARERGLQVDEADALGWDGYGGYDIVFFNRVFADQDSQARLEQQVYAGMKPGAVVIAANLLAPPPRTWYPVLDDGEVRRWILQKPLPGARSILLAARVWFRY